ncbi:MULTISPECIES: BLUF domain-containing protein [Maribacter]|uniref:BLUF domain-containing protein n=1 Tax=Maribacter TaxID=252356 RepID=UPI0023EBC5C8|nr:MULTISPECIES: BLUF domain-containing protein [Maribacter]MDF4220796.1 BLUF domain-containing protein [Maribacter huludaoensis]
MYTLTYESVATKKLKTVEMEELLENARANNERDDITGCLIYYKGGFVQLLEGSKKNITELYDKIKKDPRHTNVTLFSDDEISKRTFPNWGMAYYPIDENNTSKYEYEQFKRNLTLLADLVTPTNVTSKQFWKKIKTMVAEPPM